VLDDIEGLLTDNRIFKQRNVDIGVVKLEDDAGPGASPASWCAARAPPGTCASRSPTSATTELDFDIPIGKNGDCYDRYLIRMEEMRQSVKIMQQCIERC
jgi:NADH-quinone oxidoreductase subunit D